MTPLLKHIWLIRQLQKKSMTFEEINEKWLRDRRGTEDENIPIIKRTFHNHINAIRKEYGIDIVCGSGYKYYIDNPDYVVASQIEPDFDNGAPKSEIRWEQRLQQPMLGGYEHNSGGCCTIGKFHCNR